MRHRRARYRNSTLDCTASAVAAPYDLTAHRDAWTRTRWAVPSDVGGPPVALTGHPAPRDQTHQREQDHSPAETGEEAEDQSAALDVHAEQLQKETTQQTADDADDDIEQDALL